MLRVVAWTALALSASAACADTPQLRAAFADARAAIRAGQGTDLVDRQLRRYALHPYLEAEAIIADLRRPDRYAAGIDRAHAFTLAYADTAIEETFRRDLLLLLAELQDWQAFVAFYTPAAANEMRECEYLSARVALGQTAELAPLVVRRWLTPRRLSAACEPAFQWLRQSGVLDAALTAQRVELLLENGQTEFARIIARRLPEEQAAAYLQWASMLEDPLTALADVANGADVPLHASSLPAAWARASVNTPARTLELLPAMLRATPSDSELAERFLRDLALGLAWDRRGEALDVFARLPWSAHDDYSLGWLVRAALWNAQWELAERALGALSAEAVTESGWVYWQARVYAQRGDHEAAAAAYAALRGRDNYYSALTAARTGQAIVPNHQPIVASGQLVEALGERAGFVRARELFTLGERVMATREWRYATADLDAAGLAAAVVLASDWRWHDVAVATATRADIYFDYRLLYPQPFAAEIASAATAQALDSGLLTGLIRQESMFRVDAVSSAGALGLAQLGVGTARDTARTLGLAQPSRSDLFDPSMNARLGAATLRARLTRFDGQLPVALAAYNAGPFAAARWLPDAPIESDIWVENIPYNETREYVRRVLWNSVVYAWLDADGAPVDTRYLLGSIAPSQDEAAAGQ